MGFMGESYREALRKREPEAVNEKFAGGAFGCPGEYFRGAPAKMCRGDFRRRCGGCWDRPYAQEEWIPYEKRDE